MVEWGYHQNLPPVFKEDGAEGYYTQEEILPHSSSKQNKSNFIVIFLIDKFL
jgi:hypothetical protein